MGSATAEDYVKAIFHLSREGGTASTTAIADRLGLAAGTVTGMLKRLAERGLVAHVPYYGARLTAAGEAEALRIVRRHRMLELFLVRRLGYGWDVVHEEAERLEHAVSAELIERIAAHLGEPRRDPHGAPIPVPGQPFADPAHPRLAEIAIGAVVVLRQVPDEDAETLRYLAQMGLTPGAEVVVLERAPFRGPLRVLVDGVERHVGAELSGHLHVEPRKKAGRRTMGSVAAVNEGVGR
ncbi:MAG: metal-dependent transcriptional regulator [Gemmatimonadetes bacterium]|nr:metal-dependent transcriptional regulator [Gemmatimonadota bacterium]